MERRIIQRITQLVQDNKNLCDGNFNYFTDKHICNVMITKEMLKIMWKTILYKNDFIHNTLDDIIIDNTKKTYLLMLFHSVQSFESNNSNDKINLKTIVLLFLFMKFILDYGEEEFKTCVVKNMYSVIFKNYDMFHYLENDNNF